jgi:hypothetical protein
MKATHPDGRTFDGDENEFDRTYGPAGFVKVDERAVDDEAAVAADDAKSAADPDDAEPKKAKASKAAAEVDSDDGK